MEALVECCCGLDVHQASVVACVLKGAPNKKSQKEVRSYGTMTRGLLALKQWLQEQGCTQVAMESTGVYWMPVYQVLEDSFRLVVGNATHIKNVPGRKTDVKDSEWIAELCRHGLIAPSFVPPPPLRELRNLLRYRRKLVASQTAERNRLLRLLETANIKLASVLSDVFGVSGRLILEALLGGQMSPEQMAELAKGSLRKHKSEILEALEGQMAEHHRFLLGMQLSRLKEIEATLERLDERIEQKLEPYRDVHERLKQLPGVDWVGAAVLIAEMGVDMLVFPTAQHAAAWAGICPGNNLSAGKRRGQANRKGNVALKTALVQAAICASKKKGSYLKDKYWRLAARRGRNKAAVAVGHKILVAAYHVLSGESYRDLGPDYLERLKEEPLKRGLVNRLERMGYRVHLEPTPAAS